MRCVRKVSPEYPRGKCEETKIRLEPCVRWLRGLDLNKCREALILVG